MSTLKSKASVYKLCIKCVKLCNCIGLWFLLKYLSRLPGCEEGTGTSSPWEKKPSSPIREYPPSILHQVSFMVIRPTKIIRWHPSILHQVHLFYGDPSHQNDHHMACTGFFFRRSWDVDSEDSRSSRGGQRGLWVPGYHHNCPSFLGLAFILRELLSEIITWPMWKWFLVGNLLLLFFGRSKRQQRAKLC